MIRLYRFASLKASFYKWSPAALDIDRVEEHGLYLSAPHRHAYERVRALLDIFLFSVQCEGLPPAVVGKGVKLLRDLGDTVGLFKLAEFQTRLSASFVSVLLKDLLEMGQPSIVDEMSSLLFEIATVDMPGFFATLLPTIINSMNIGNAEKQTVLDSWNSSEVTKHSFEQNANEFLSEFRYYTSATSP
ncbi:hypothetical protein TeGR_g10629 [Tetraparma gracilis]|uniref:Uncharacterized protein n=1 Tax=Tetraparma gracilis TaxID=2962635 RepID=A0ABQ6NCX3_9STRA|nr:hypothetical protein TeGR_g10629 [Tetraparma gracilis]